MWLGGEPGACAHTPKIRRRPSAGEQRAHACPFAWTATADSILQGSSDLRNQLMGRHTRTGEDAGVAAHAVWPTAGAAGGDHEEGNDDARCRGRIRLGIFPMPSSEEKEGTVPVPVLGPGPPAPSHTRPADSRQGGVNQKMSN